MAYVVRTSKVLQVPAIVAFDCLADHDSWPRWMPTSFRPVGRPVGRLTEGARFRVRILGLPFAVTCKVRVVRSPVEITWCGGMKGAFWADHRFLFEPSGDASVEVQSVESWEGPLAALLRRGIEPGARKVGWEQLGALAAAAGSTLQQV